MTEITENELKKMTKDQCYMRGYSDGKLDTVEQIRAELIQAIQNGVVKIEKRNVQLFATIDKHCIIEADGAVVN